MLCDAALHTLEMQQLALAEGLILKDAAPTNIVFRGSRPVFVDFLSFVGRETGEYLWRARHQFDACFLLPLLFSLEASIPIAWTLRDFLHGVSHEQAQRILGVQDLAQALLLGNGRASPRHVSRKVSAIGATHAARRRMDDDARARFTLEHQNQALHRKLTGLRSRLASRGVALGRVYDQPGALFRRPTSTRNAAFVRGMLESAAPASVLDLGANTGEFSELAAARARVVAVDIDEQSVSGIAERARSRSLDIHPLVGNLAQPTPAEGWRNAETRSLIDAPHAGLRPGAGARADAPHPHHGWHSVRGDRRPAGGTDTPARGVRNRAARRRDVRRDGAWPRAALRRLRARRLPSRHLQVRFNIVRRKELANGRILMLLEKR